MVGTARYKLSLVENAAPAPLPTLQAAPASVLLQVDAVAGIAGHAQLRDLLLEGLLCFGAARFEGDLRRVSGALVEVRKASPNLGRRIGVAARIAIDVGLPLIRVLRKEMRERHQHHR